MTFARRACVRVPAQRHVSARASSETCALYGLRAAHSCWVGVYLPTHRASVARRAQMAKYKFTGALTAADTWFLAVNAPVMRYRLGNTY